MRAVIMRELGRLELANVPEPVVSADDEVKVKVKAVGICGTDLHMFCEAREDVVLPRIMGHELSGVVTEVGGGVSRVKIGDSVVLDPVFACGVCPTCQKGYPNVCERVRCYGVQMDGGLQDYIVVKEEHLYPYKDSIPFVHAALAEPFSIAFNIAQRLQITQEDKVLILGSGTIGLSLLQVVKSLGTYTVVADKIDEKLAIAREMGANETVNSDRECLKSAAEHLSGSGFDVILDAAGLTSLLEEAFAYAAPRARISCIGFEEAPAQIPPAWITRKELSVIGSRMNCHQFPTVMKWLEEGKINAGKMISRQYPVRDIQRAFTETLADRTGSIKTVIVFDEEEEGR